MEQYFFNKILSNIETINDIDSDITNLFKAIRENTDELLKSIKMTLYSREEYNNAFIVNEEDENVELARKFLIRCWQSIGSNNKYKTGWKNERGIKKKVRGIRIEDIVSTQDGKYRGKILNIWNGLDQCYMMNIKVRL